MVVRWEGEGKGKHSPSRGGGRGEEKRDDAWRRLEMRICVENWTRMHVLGLGAFMRPALPSMP